MSRAGAGRSGLRGVRVGGPMPGNRPHGLSARPILSPQPHVESGRRLLFLLGMSDAERNFLKTYKMV